MHVDQPEEEMIATEVLMIEEGVGIEVAVTEDQAGSTNTVHLYALISVSSLIISPVVSVGRI